MIPIKNTYFDDGVFPNQGETFPSKPSKEEAHQVFWNLGDDFWKQFIDGKFHVFGPLVFDEGTHNGPKEPGFFNSLKIGCDFASKHLSEPLTISFYKDLHKKLCSHFKGSENSTHMHAEETGLFRVLGSSFSFSIKNDISDFAKEQYEIFETFENYKKNRETCLNLLELLGKACSETDIENCKAAVKKLDTDMDNWKKKDAYPAAKKWVTEWEAQWIEKKTKLAEYIERCCLSLSIPKICWFSFEDLPKIRVIYKTFESENDVEKIVQILFDNYNHSIEEINSKFSNCGSKAQAERLLDEKITLIADLYQMLEWLHPFPDGQGRTDLVLLCKLLCEQGLNPAILEQPYMSSYSTLQEWKDYLVKGMLLWKK